MNANFSMLVQWKDHVWRVDVWKSNEIFNVWNVIEILTIPITRKVFQHRLFWPSLKREVPPSKETYVNDIDFEIWWIWWIWLWKRILPVYTTNMKLTWTGSTFNKLMTLILKYDEYDYGKEFYLIILQTWSLPGQGLHSTS